MRGEYRHRTILGARRHDVELLVQEELSLRAGYRRSTNSPPVRATCVHARALYLQRACRAWTHVLSTYNVRATHLLPEFFFE